MLRYLKRSCLGCLITTAIANGSCQARLAADPVFHPSMDAAVDIKDHHDVVKKVPQLRQLQTSEEVSEVSRSQPLEDCEEVQHQDSVLLSFGGSTILPFGEGTEELKNLFVHAYNALIQAAVGCPRRNVLAVDLVPDTLLEQFDEWSIEALVTWTCRGCEEDETLFEHDDDDDDYFYDESALGYDCDVSCPAISIYVFEQAYRLLVEASDSLVDLHLSEVAELEQVVCPTDARDSFASTLVLDVTAVSELVGNENLLQTLQDAILTSLQQRIFGLERRSYCDPYFREVTSVALEPRNGPSQRRELVVPESVNPPNHNFIGGNSGVNPFDGASPTVSPSPTMSPGPTSSPAPTVTAPPTNPPTDRFQFAYLSFLLEIGGTCRGCQNGQFLWNDVRGRRRAAAHLPGQSRRKLEVEESSDEECICPTGSLLRSPTEEEIRGQFHLDFQADPALNAWVQNVVGTFEVHAETCTGSILQDSTFVGGVHVYHSYDDFESFPRSDRQFLEWAFLEAYNEVMDEYCDPLFRWVVGADLVESRPASNDDRNADIRLHRLLFDISFEYRTADSVPLPDVGLFSTDRLRDLRSWQDSKSSIEVHQHPRRRRGRRLSARRMSGETECYCPSDPIAHTAPDPDVFLAVLYEIIQEGIQDGGLNNVFLSADGYTSSDDEPTASPTTFEERESDNNDFCGGAEEVWLEAENSSENFVVLEGTTESATVDRDTVVCGWNLLPSAPGVWYRLVGMGADVSASTCHERTNFATQITVYAGRCGDLVCVSTNDGGCDGQSSSVVSWYAEEDETYFILVHGYESATGLFGLSFT